MDSVRILMDSNGSRGGPGKGQVRPGEATGGQEMARGEPGEAREARGGQGRPGEARGGSGERREEASLV